MRRLLLLAAALLALVAAGTQAAQVQQQQQANTPPKPAAAAAVAAAGTQAAQVQQQQQQLLVGIAKADVTGPAAEVGMMAYAVLNQTAKGIHTRQFARAYAFADPSTQKRFMMVVVDQAMISQLVTNRVVQQLQVEFGGLYTTENVMLTATHTHATAAGHLEHFLYHITSWGIVWPTVQSLVDGIVEACRAAHADLRPAALSWTEGELLGANINRSPTAYLENPESERALYTHDVDKEMTVLRVQSAEPGGKGRGMVTWFPVHPVSMSNQNRLLSSDNKGVAQQFVENRWAPNHPEALEPGFTAAFAQSNTGDTTPNVLGTFCVDSGLPCDAVSSTCNGGNNQLCIGRGPAWPEADEAKSCEIIGQRQADKAQELWSTPGHTISGPLDFRHMFIEISDTEVQESEFTRAGHTCLGAMGYSMAAGTTDGPGAPRFYQSEIYSSGMMSVWAPLASLINNAARGHVSKSQQQCHGTKPVLLNVGETALPYPWVPSVTQVALLRLGNFVLVFLPGEFTTMSGRRVRRAVHKVLSAAWGVQDLKVVITSYTNTYSSYVTTYEEYQMQRYEGGSTLFGPHTLDAYIQTAVHLAQAMAAGQPVTSTVTPPSFEHKLLSFLPPVVVDTVPAPHKFGEAIKQPRDTYTPGEVVEAVFWSANPRNNLRRGGTFLEVQYQEPTTGQWQVLYNDDDWSTKFEWDRPKGQLSSESTATVRWTVPSWTKPGQYRIKLYGDAKSMLGAIVGFEGLSREFAVGA